MSAEKRTRLDTVFDLLSHGERRRLLYYLREHGSVTRSELADVLAGWLATDRPAGSTTEADRARIVTRLYHQHLPALRDGGLVTTSADGDVVETTDWPPWVDRCLDVAFDVETTASAESETDPRIDDPTEDWH